MMGISVWISVCAILIFSPSPSKGNALTNSCRKIYEDALAKSTNGELDFSGKIGTVDCSDDIDVHFHCLKDENRRQIELCVPWLFIDEGLCPSYVSYNNKMHVEPCNTTTRGCPMETYKSYEFYKYPGCLELLETKSKNITSLDQKAVKGTARDTTREGASAVGVVIAGVIVVCLLIAFLVIFVRWKRTGKLAFRWHVRHRQENTEMVAFIEEQNSSKWHLQFEDSSTEGGFVRSITCFVETKFYEDVILALERGNKVVIVGKTGIGKTATCVGVVEYYKNKLGWEILDVTPTQNNVQIRNKTIILIDCPLGDLSLYEMHSSKISRMLHDIYSAVDGGVNVKLLLTSSVKLSDEIKSKYAILHDIVEMELEKTDFSTDELIALQTKYTDADTCSSFDRDRMCSEYGLPPSCYIHGIEVETVEKISHAPIDVISNYLEDLISGNDKKQYHVLVLMMLNGGVLNEHVNEYPHDKAKSLGLSPDEVNAKTREMTRRGLLYKLNGTYKFSNDLLLISVVRHYAKAHFDNFMNLAYFPFLPQFLHPTPKRSPILVEIKDKLQLLSAVERRWFKESRSPTTAHPLIKKFHEVLSRHENCVRSYNARKWSRLTGFWTRREWFEWEEKERRFVRNMIEYHPYLKDYYSRTQESIFSSFNNEDLQPKNKTLDCCR